jgi:Choline/ethanolamine kinase
MAENLQASDPAMREAFTGLDISGMRAEVAAVQELCARTNSPTVFCHNDLLSGNIMALGVAADQRYDEVSDPQLTLIDFEYGSYGPRGFDWGAPCCQDPPHKPQCILVARCTCEWLMIVSDKSSPSSGRLFGAIALTLLACR